MSHAKHHILKAIAMIAVAIVLGLLTGCKAHEPIVVERVTHDTLYRLQFSRDSIYLRDSIYITERMQGDTLTITRDRWHTQYRDRLLRDTTYIHQTDTIPKVVEVPAKLTAWQRLKMSLWWVVFVELLIIAFLALVIDCLRRR